MNIKSDPSIGGGSSNIGTGCADAKQVGADSPKNDGITADEGWEDVAPSHHDEDATHG